MKRTLALVTLATTLLAAACGGSGDGADGGACSALSDPQDVVRVYGSAWNEPDPAKRLCALTRALTEDATYVDPTVDTTTREGLADAIGQFLASTPGASIVVTSGLDVRAGELRFTWEFQAGGVTVVRGVDYMELADDGRISSIRGYWEPLPGAVPEGVLAAYARAWTEGDAAALSDAVADGVRFTSPEQSITGVADLSALVSRSASVGPTLVGAQAYPKFARVAFRAEDGSAQWTDYLHLDGAGRIVRIARFEGGFPAP